MKVLFKGLTGILLGCVCLLCASSDIYAGTAVYVGKDVSAENTTLIGASFEGGIGTSAVPVVIDKGVYKKGDVIECSNGYKYTLPDDNVKLTLEKFMAYAGYGDWNCCASNEYGVSVVVGIEPLSNQAAAEADPFEACGICEEKMPLILVSTAKNAKEAVDILCAEYDKIGADESEIVLIADQEGAWLVENFTGHEYAAVKLPADKAAVFSNEHVLTTADLEKADVICSGKLLTLPVDKGFAVYDDDKNLDLAASYGETGPYTDEMKLRRWVGHAYFCDKEDDKFDPKATVDVFHAPEAKIGINSVFAFFRNRYEGTEYETTLGEDEITYGGIDNQFVTNVSVIQILDDVPAQMSSVIWTTPSQALASPFIPIPLAADSLPDNLATDVAEDAYTDGILQLDFGKLNTRIVARRNVYGSDIKSLWEGSEILSTSEVLGLLRGEWNEKFASAPGQVADEADQFVVSEAATVADTCDALESEFDWYLFRNGVYNSKVKDEDIAPFALENDYTVLGSAFENGWAISSEGDIVTATKDGKTIEFSVGEDGESSVKLTGFDNDRLIGDLFTDDDDDLMIELEDIEGDLDADDLSIELDEGEAEAEEAAEEEAAAEAATEEAAPTEEAAAEEAVPTEEAAAEEAAPAEESAKEEAAPAEETAKEEVAESAVPAEDPAVVDTIADLQNYFAEKIANVPRDGWAENEIANELADVSNDVAGILAGYINTYAEKYLGDLNGDIDDVEKIMSIDPEQAANELANDVATDADIAKAGQDLNDIGVFISGLLGNYFNSLAEDVSGDVSSGRLSQEGAVRILNEAETDIIGVVNAYVEVATGKVAEVTETVKGSIPPKDDLKETLGEIDDALDVLEEYGVIDKDAIGLGDAKLADLAELTDADIDVVVTLSEMDEATIDGLSALLGVDVKAALDQYIDQINAAGLGITINK